jgi:hypothetical protein
METLTTYNKISTEISEKLFDYLNTPETKEFIEKMKASEEDSGRFEVVISTADQDRQGEVIDQNGWDLSHYKNNPVVLWGHNYTSLPIGVADSVDVKGGKLVASGRFAPESANPFAQQVRRLYDAKILRTTSVGFMAREMDGNTITKAELLEFSFVPVPANPMALSLMKEISFDSAALIQKGFLFEEKATKEKPGDPCTTDDGEDGVFEEGEDGVLVCSVPPTKSEEDAGEKSGRVLSVKSRGHIETAILGIKGSLVALEELLKAVDLGGEDESGESQEIPSEERSSSEPDAKGGFKEWDRERQFLRVINNITSDALHKFNEKHHS